MRVLVKKGTLPRPEFLRLSVRYLTDGAILGSREFINSLFERHRERFGPRRTSGARPVRGLDGDSLASLRALRVRVFA